MLNQQREPENETQSATVQPEPSGASSSLATSEQRNSTHDEQILAKIANRIQEQEEKEQQNRVAREKAQASQNVENILIALREETQKRQKRTRRMWWIVGGVAIVYTTWTVFAVATRSNLPPIVILASFLGVFSAAFAVSQEQIKAVHELADYDDVRGVGYLVEALKFNDGAERKAVLPALQRLLPRLQSSDADLLNTQQRTILRREAQENASPDLTIAILKAWEQIGDERDLETVNHLLTRPGLSAHVIFAAQDCSPFLQQRIERQRQSATLLRASDVSSAHPEHLLRPAEANLANNAVAPEQLLRPTTGDRPS